MTIQRVPSVPFAQIANAALRDRRLSFKARGILALVLSNVGEWEATVSWIEGQSDRDGPDAIRTGLRELTALGYRKVVQERDEHGHVRNVAYWFHEPESAESRGEDPDLMRIIQRSDNPTIGLSNGRETGGTIEHYPSEHYSLEHQEITTSVSRGKNRGAYTETFEEFWKVYPRKVAKQQAWRRWRQVVRNVSPHLIIEGARRYRDDPNRDDEFTAHAATWLHHGRWDDPPLPEKRGRATAGQARMDNYRHILDTIRVAEGREITQ